LPSVINMLSRILSAFLVFVTFLIVQLSLSFLCGELVDWLLLDNNPDWYEGPFGGIHQFFVFVFLIPFSIFITVKAWRSRRSTWKAKRKL
jgi:hypothetical protein